MSALSTASIEGRTESQAGTSVLTFRSLNVAQISTSVSDDSTGATAVFIGTTRNSYKGKVVTRLEYQAYTKLALKTMDDILHSTRQSIRQGSTHDASGKIPSIHHAVIHHRLGHVPVGEPSVVIAVSSPHRREAFVACERILEEVKRRAQIWKREFYEGESDEGAEWKENS